MEKHSRKPSSWAIALLLGVAVASLCLGLAVLIEPMVSVGAQSFRSLQVWPDRSMGVSSGLLEDLTVHAATQVLPLGAYRTPEDDVVQARTYLHFPLDVFPPGTEILRATLYMYVDSSSDTGEADFGVYRALEPWEGVAGDWEGNPVSWPELLNLPLAATTVRFGVLTTTPPVSITVFTATPDFTPTPTLTPAATSTATLTPTPFTSPLLTPSPTFTPSPTPFSTFPASVVPLEQVAETWLVWDVTALMRAWLTGEVPNDGLALASAPDPTADPEAMGDLLAARWFAAGDSDTRPYIITEFEVHPVTPTPPTSPLPTPSPAPILPPAGSPMNWRAVELLFVGMVLLVLGLVAWKR